MARTSKRTTRNRKQSRSQRNSSKRWIPIALAVVGIIILAVVGWYLFDQTQAEAIADRGHGEGAEAVEYVHTEGDVELPDIHGMGFSLDGKYLSVAVHDGLRIFTQGEWLIPDVPKNDYMGYSPVDSGFYSSGHPGPGSRLVNPLGLVKSSDMGKTLTKLGFEGESDFHLMDVGYENHAIYVLNPSPNSRLSVGLHYSLDDGESWQQGALQGITAQPIAIAVHPTEANVIALATEGGLFLSTDYGNTFKPVAQDGFVTAANFSPDGDGLLFGYQALSSYNIESETIETVTTPAIAYDDAIAYVAVNPAAPDEIALATFSRDIYLSEDSGETWQQIAQEGKGKEVQ